MRIVLSNASSRWGGVHKVTEVLARGLQARGHDIVTFGYPGGMLEERMKGIAPFEPILKGMDLHPVVLWRAVSALRRHHSDAVLTLMKKDVMLTAPAAASLGIPVVVRHANQRPIGSGIFWRILYGRIPALHIANAEATKRTLLESAPWLRDGHVEVIYNGIEPAGYIAAAPLPLGLPAGAIVAGYAGSFEARKGVRELSQAWHDVSRAMPDAYLLLVGKGRMENEMRAILGDAQRVVWLGYRRDIASVLRSLDVMVLPSHVEGAPNIVLEAMCAGTPILATAVSGTPELVRDNIEARLIEPRNAGALASGLIEMLSNPGLRRRLAAAAAVRVAERFGLGTMLDSYEEMFSRTIRAAGRVG